MPTVTTGFTANGWNDLGAPNTVFDHSNNCAFTGNDPAHAYSRFTMPSDPFGAGSVITSVSLDMHCNASGVGNNSVGYDVHQTTQTGWVDTQATWNNYSTGNAWATAGGDFSATVIQHIPPQPSGGSAGPFSVEIGPLASSPYPSLTWGTVVDIFWVASNTNAGTLAWDSITGPVPPVVTVTYTPPPGLRSISGGAAYSSPLFY